MSKIRIALPLWKRKLHEDGFRLSPTPADVLPPPDNERKDHFDLPPRSRLSNLRYTFDGWQQSPLSDDNDLSVKHEHDLVHPGLSRHVDKSWLQSPLSDDSREAAAKFHFDLPQFGKNPLNEPWTTQQSSPLAADSAEENQETITRKVDELSQLNKITQLIRHSFDGWIQSPLSTDVEDPAVQPVFPDQVPARPRADGFSFSPLPDSVEDSLVMPTYVDFEFRKTHPQDFQASPLAADNDNPPAPALPEFPFERSVYFGFQTSPTVEEPAIQLTLPWPEYPNFMTPRYDSRDISLYIGASQTPLSGDVVALTDGIYRPTFRPRRR